MLETLKMNTSSTSVALSTRGSGGMFCRWGGGNEKTSITDEVAEDTNSL